MVSWVGEITESIVTTEIAVTVRDWVIFKTRMV